MVEGFVELLRAYQVRGWAHDPSAPGHRAKVELRVDGDLLDFATADHFRQDLADAQIGDGRHGFIINVDVEIPLGSIDRVTVVAHTLDGEGVTLPCSDSFQVEKVEISGEDFGAGAVGFFSVSEEVVDGWAYDPLAPAAALKVELRDGEIVIAAVVADQFRPDLVTVCDGRGEHGFLERKTEAGSFWPQSTTAYAEDVSGEWRKLIAIPREGASRDRSVASAAPSVDTLSFPFPSTDPEQRPIFILGAARSGTSAMAQALTAATRYKGPEEGHFFDLVSNLLSAVDRFYEMRADEWSKRSTTLIAAAPKPFLADGVRSIFVEFARARFPTRIWLDKTPRVEMIAAAPQLHAMFPNARFIFMKRRAIENIESRRRKFPHANFEHHCREWAAAMSTWTSVRDQLGDSAVEVDQFELAAKPDAVIETLSAKLEFSSSERERLLQTLRDDKPERTSRSLTTCRSLADHNWPEDQLSVFHRLCGPAMSEYGYSLGDDYAVQRMNFGWGEHAGYHGGSANACR